MVPAKLQDTTNSSPYRAAKCITAKVFRYLRKCSFLVLLGIFVNTVQRSHWYNNELPRVSANIVRVDRDGRTTFVYSSALQKYKDVPEWMHRYPFLPAIDDVDDKERICFVHVGKTAGSTLACYLGFNFPVCQYRMKVLPGKLPQLTTNVMHTHYDTCYRENISLYLFTVRDPVSRMQSWFTYERPANEQARDYKYKKLLFVDCGFKTLNELGGERGLGANGNTICSKRAFWAIQGMVGFKVRWMFVFVPFAVCQCYVVYK